MNHKTKLAALIEQRGMTVTDAALACGKNVSQFSLYARGARPSKATARQIEAKMKVEPGALWPELTGAGAK